MDPCLQIRRLVLGVAAVDTVKRVLPGRTATILEGDAARQSTVVRALNSRISLCVCFEKFMSIIVLGPASRSRDARVTTLSHFELSYFGEEAESDRVFSPHGEGLAPNLASEARSSPATLFKRRSLGTTAAWGRLAGCHPVAGSMRSW